MLRENIITPLNIYVNYSKRSDCYMKAGFLTLNFMPFCIK
jgi:hypothetical protein